jgi:arylsulfatase A-like enzyme
MNTPFNSLGVLAVAASLCLPVHAGEGGPNIILIVADDLGIADVTLYGTRTPTPNIDRIGNGGVVFRQGYVTAPLCSPSRAGLITGRYQQRFGFEYNARDAPDGGTGLPESETTIAEYLGAAGYRTGIVGKWHLGARDSDYPTNRGFDEFFGIVAGATDYIDPTLPHVRSLTREHFAAYLDIPEPELPALFLSYPRVKGSRIVRGDDREVVDNYDRYLTDELGCEAVDFVTRHRARPFFLYLAFNAPHSPFQVTEKYYNRFLDKPSEIDRVYSGMVSAMDDAVGNLLDVLEELDLAENTIVVFLGDNGCAAYFPGVCPCEPVSGGKGTYYEGGVRVPFLLRWPARIEAGMSVSTPVSSLDVLPTVLGAVGIESASDRAFDGRDLLPFLEGRKSGVAHGMLAWRNAPAAAVRLGDFKLIKPDQDGALGHLYDLTTDPKEKRDLASERRDVVRLLEAAFSEWRGNTVPPSWPPRAINTYTVCGIEPVPFPD